MSHSWENAHHDYSMWDTAPNAPLLYNNNFFDQLRGNEPVFLAHVTTVMDSIVESGKIYPSGGSLVGSVYCVPTCAIDAGRSFRLHNLGAYYYLKEIPGSLGQPGDVSILLVEIPRHANAPFAVEGVNYLRMGNIHYDTFVENRDSFSSLGLTERIESTIENSLDRQERFLIAVTHQHRGTYPSASADLDFLRSASEAVHDLPFLGYVLFEALSLAIMLFQVDEQSAKLRALGEFNNWHYKNLMFAAYPAFGKDWRLSSFAPVWEDVFSAVESLALLSPSTSIDRFVSAVARKARKLICDNFFVDARSFLHLDRNLVSGKVQWAAAEKSVRPLLGHLLHRYLRSAATSALAPWPYRLLEQTKATSIWNYWSKRGIAVPFTGGLPKGEVGFLPTLPNVRFYEAGVTATGEDWVTVAKGRELSLRVQPELGSLHHTFRRSLTGIEIR